MNKLVRPKTGPEGDPEYRSIIIKESPHTTVNYDVWFYSFEDNSVATEFFQTLLNAGANSEIVIHLCNCGGSVETGVQLIHHIEQALVRGVKVTLSLEGSSYSMGSLFATKLLKMGAGIIPTNQPFYLMFHDWADRHGGKGHEMTAYLEASNKLLREIFIDYASPFFTAKEVDEILAGKDRYLNRHQILKKFEEYVKGQKKEKKTKKASKSDIKK